VDDFLKTPNGRIQNKIFKDPYWAEKEEKI